MKVCKECLRVLVGGYWSVGEVPKGTKIVPVICPDCKKRKERS